MHWSVNDPIELNEDQLIKASQALIQDHDNFIFDLDGVVWRASTAIPGAFEALNALKASGKRVFFASNNSMSDASQFRAKFKRLNLGDWDEWHFYTTASAIADMVKQDKVKGNVLLMGPPSVRKYLVTNPDIKVVELPHKSVHPHDMDNEEIDMDIQAIVMGFDRNFCYYTCAYAAILLMSNPNIKFYLTNEDMKFVSRKHTLPGSGALVQALISSTGKKPVVIGKPSTFIGEMIIKEHNLDRARTCMVGDNFQTDISFGAANGFSTLLVESGVHTRRYLDEFASTPSQDTNEEEVQCSCKETGRYLCASHSNSANEMGTFVTMTGRIVLRERRSDHSPPKDLCPIPDFIFPSINTLLKGISAGRE